MNITPAVLVALAKGDLDNALVAALPGGIEAQERAGQLDLVEQFDRLPRRGPKEIAERLGFTIGEPIDDVFNSVTAPEGWSLCATDHSMWSNIVDDTGAVRGSVFYKAAFYDRNANFDFFARYYVTNHYGDEVPDDVSVTRILDRKTGAILGEDRISKVPERPTYWNERDALENRLRDTLAAQYPEHADSTAYWND